MVVVSERRADGRLVLTITDTGVGMTAEQIAVARRPFGQVRSEISQSHQPGTGLGIPIVEALMQARGGELEFDSQPAKGTSARLIFPLDRILRPGDER